ncbi:TonB-dependent receptor [Oxalobacteraceae bacterium OM1]|nr:TonB-dependent receptor [Oxalobacteraceae bacterium OM1]
MTSASPRIAVTPLATALVLAFSASAPTAVFAQAAADRKADTVVVTATRTPQVATDVLADNVTITSEDIARSGETTLVNLLQRQRGIEIGRNGGPGTTASVFIRGTNNNQSLVLVDGVRIGSSTTGGATWSAIPLTQIDRIEIVYGPLSSLYGADAIGGVVQIFTKQGEGAPSVTAAAGFGSYNTRTLEGGVSGSTSGENGPKWRYALRAAHEASDGFSATTPGAFGFNPDKDGYKNDSVSGRLGAEWAKGHEAGINFLQSRLENQFDSSANFDDRGVQRLGTVALFSKDQLTQNWRSTVQLARSDDKGESTSSFGTTRFDTRQNLYSWQNDIALGSDVLQLLAERREETVDSTTSDLNRSRNTNAFAGAYQLRRGAHLVSASLRNDDSSQFGSHTTGSVAYGYRLSSTLRVNASYGTSFRAPTFNELYFPNFGFAGNRPEQGRNTEAGVYYDDGKSTLSAVAYRNRITDLIVSTPVCPVEPATHSFGCAYNVNQALLTGITFGGSTRLGATTLRASIDLQDPRDETTDRLLVRRARQHATVGVEHAIGRALVGADWAVSGKRYDNAANTVVLGGYGLLDLHADYDVAPNWSVVGRWNNVLNKRYELVRTYATPESNLFVGVRYGMR